MKDHLTPNDLDGVPIAAPFWVKLSIAAVCLCWVILAIAVLA